MARVEARRERIGDMLVAAGLVTTAQLQEALSAQAVSRLPIGKQLVSMGCVSEVQLTQLLSHQLSVPWVSLDRVEFSQELLAKVPGQLADRFTVMPIYVRAVRHQGATLYIAMDDPTHEEALRSVSIASGLPVKPMIASPSDIRREIDEHYFGGASEQPAEQHVATPFGSRELPAAEAAGEGRGGRPRPPPPPKLIKKTSDGVVSVELYETPSSPPAQEPRTLTFLDGTTVSVPKRAKGKLALDVGEVRHVIKAARAANADLGIEGAPKWHDVVQVILDVLDARGVRLSRKEIHEAWLKARRPDQDRK